MVGEISPDGNFVWNGTEWMPKDAVTTNQQIVDESSNNVFQLGGQELAGDVDWKPVTDKSDEGGKGKIIAMSVVGMLILSALGWVLYLSLIHI